MGARIHSTSYDPSCRPASQKAGVLMGMAMTEKQGGSDVRANTTTAEPIGSGAYVLDGHKWFCSAPMCDAFLVLAQAPGGLSCFFLPRWTPDGQPNGFHLQRLKSKLGNRSNALSEVEFHGAWALLVGEEGRGVAFLAYQERPRAMNSTSLEALERFAQFGFQPLQVKSVGCSVGSPARQQEARQATRAPAPAPGTHRT